MAITPYLYYEDVAAAMTFLAKAFGCRKAGRPMTNAEGRVVHAAMKLGDDVVMMGWPGPDYRNPRRIGQATQNLYVEVKSLRGRFERARRAGATVLQEPRDTDYGARRFGVEDPEGHQWYFAERTQPAGPER